MGNKKYFTEEERKQANRDKVKRHYERNKEMVKQKQLERYYENKEKIAEDRKISAQLLKMYKDGKIDIG